MRRVAQSGKVHLDQSIEVQGIERVPATARSHLQISDNFTFWLSANTVLSTMMIGTLGVSVFRLGSWDSIGTIILFNGLGVLPVAFFSTLGSKLGLRQMTISRFSFGWIGASLMAIVNGMTCIGWSVVNVIVGGQLVQALSGNKIPGGCGILAITLLTTIVSLYGYRQVHRYERFAWIPMVLIFGAIAVINLPHATVVPSRMTGLAYVAALLSFGSAIYGATAGWAPYAADYSVKQPETTRASSVFVLTFLGIWIPSVVLESLGVLLMSVPALSSKSGGELVATALSPLGASGKLLMLCLALSVVANNIPNDYSLALSIQVLGGVFQRIKRWIWTLFGSVVYAMIAIAASANFNETLEQFLLMIAYWLAPWAVILAIEHQLRRGHYNVEDWNNPARLPIGWAAIAAMGLGLVGVYLGAAQTAFVGLIARQLNPPFGADIGFELGGLFAAIAYLVLRPIERRSTQR